jgi:type III secretion protein V
MPKALRVAAGFIFLLALVPGLPAVPFLVIAAVLFMTARARGKAMTRDDEQAAVEPTQKAQTGRTGPVFVPMVVPWSIDLSASLETFLDDGDKEVPGLRARLTGLREAIFAELGVPLPAPRVRVAENLAPRTFALSLFEVPARVVEVPKEVPDAEVVSFILDRSTELLRGRAADFLGLSETQRLLDELEQFAPAVVRNVVPKPVSLTLLTDILRRLVEEGVSIRDMRAILENLATLAATEKDPLNLSEQLRAQMRRAVTHRLTRGQHQLGVITLDPLIEDTVRRAVTRTPAGAFLTLAPAAGRDIILAVKRAVGEAAQQPHQVIILTQPDIRRFVKKMVEGELPGCTVTSYAELLPEVALRPLARANLAGIG